MTTTPDARTRMDQLIKEHPELEPYTWPMSAGESRALGAKLDRIIELLEQLVVSGVHR